MGGLYKKVEVDKRKGLRIPQESIDYISKGIAQMKNKSEIAREVQKRAGITWHGAYKRVEAVWRMLAKEAGVEVKVERHKISRALLEIYREARDTSVLDKMVDKLLDAGITGDKMLRVLSKWDPHKSQAIAIKALDQYTKLHGLNAPEQVEVSNTHGVVSPLKMKPQDRHKRIAELIKKHEAQLGDTPQQLESGSGIRSTEE